MSSTNLGNTSNSKYPTTLTIGGTVAVTQATTPWIVAGNQTPGDAIANPSDAVDTRTFLEIFNGATWDRIREATGDAASAIGIQADGNMVFNGTTWDRMRSGTATGSVLVNNNIAANLQVTTTPAAGSTTVVLGNQTPGDAVANPTDGLDTRTFNEVFNGTTWDRARTVGIGSTGVATTGISAVGNYIANLASGLQDQTRAATQDAATANGLPESGNMVFNGTTWDRMRSGTATGSVLVNNNVAANLQVTTTPAAGTTVVVAGAQTPGDGITNPTDALDTRDFLEVWNGATWDRLREPTADALAVTGIPAAGNMVWNGATWDRMREGATTGAVRVTVTGPAAATQSIAAGTSAITTGTTLDNLAMMTNHTVVVTTSAGVTSGIVTFQLSQDNTNFFPAVTVGCNAASSVFVANFTGAFRYIRASITTAIVGGTVGVTVASV